MRLLICHHPLLAKDDLQAARLVVMRIHHAVSLMAGNPALGHPGRIHGTSELVVPDTRNIVPYRVRPRLARIEILRVFHSARSITICWNGSSLAGCWCEGPLARGLRAHFSSLLEPLPHWQISGRRRTQRRLEIGFRRGLDKIF